MGKRAEIHEVVNDPLTNIVYPLVHVGVAALLFGTTITSWMYALEGTEHQPIAWGCAAASFTALVLWLIWLAHRYISLWRVEKWLGLDLDRDGRVGYNSRGE